MQWSELTWATVRCMWVMHISKFIKRAFLSLKVLHSFSIHFYEGLSSDGPPLEHWLDMCGWFRLKRDMRRVWERQRGLEINHEMTHTLCEHNKCFLVCAPDKNTLLCFLTWPAWVTPSAVLHAHTFSLFISQVHARAQLATTVCLWEWSSGACGALTPPSLWWLTGWVSSCQSCCLWRERGLWRCTASCKSTDSRWWWETPKSSCAYLFLFYS